jgi:hypothetical protein
MMDRVPGSKQSEGREERRQDDEKKRNTVNPDVVADIQPGDPHSILFELEARRRSGIESEEQEERNDKCHHCCQESYKFDRLIVFSADEEQCQNPQHGEEDRECQ